MKKRIIKKDDRIPEFLFLREPTIWTGDILPDEFRTEADIERWVNDIKEMEETK